MGSTPDSPNDRSPGQEVAHDVEQLASNILSEGEERRPLPQPQRLEEPDAGPAQRTPATKADLQRGRHASTHTENLGDAVDHEAIWMVYPFLALFVYGPALWAAWGDSVPGYQCVLIAWVAQVAVPGSLIGLGAIGAISDRTYRVIVGWHLRILLAGAVIILLSTGVWVVRYLYF